MTDDTEVRYVDETKAHAKWEPFPTVRDRFAMAALTGLIEFATIGQPGNAAALAKIAYEHADAMLEARDQ